MPLTSAYGKIGQLLRELSDDEDDDDRVEHSDSTSTTGDASGWYAEFYGYLNSRDQLAPGMSVVQWWGLNAARYPVWASLARDYLSVMATSVSSERAFSSAGITISKRRNRLQADIVEALQCLKCLIRHDLLFREDPSVLSEITGTNDIGSILSASQEEGAGEGWDEFMGVADGSTGLDDVDEGDDIAMVSFD